MTDDLVERLRDKYCCDGINICNCDESADRIEELTNRNKELEAALRVAAGYISTKEGHTDQHPQDVYDWIIRAALGEKKDD